MATFKNMDYLNENGINYVDLGDGVKYFIYTPENVTPDTEVFVYTYGSGLRNDLYQTWHGSMYGIIDGILENGSDSVIIMPCFDNGEEFYWGEKTYEIVSQVKQELNITNTNLTGSGFSWGGVRSLVASAQNIYDNEENIDPQVYFMVDDYSHAYNNPENVLKNWKVGDKCYGDIFKDNQSVFFFFENPGKGAGRSGYNEANSFANYGINTIKVECSDAAHTHINSNCWKNAIFNFMSGTSELPTEGYTYKIRNSEGKWEVIDVNEINTLDKLYSYFGIDTYQMKLDKLAALKNSYSVTNLTSNVTTLSEYERVVNNEISNSNFVQSNINYDDSYFESTTKIPSQILNIVNNFYEANANLLLKISNDVSQFVKIGQYFEAGDQEYANKATNIGNTPTYTETIDAIHLVDTTAKEDTQEVSIDSEVAAVQAGYIGTTQTNSTEEESKTVTETNSESKTEETTQPEEKTQEPTETKDKAEETQEQSQSGQEVVSPTETTTSNSQSTTSNSQGTQGTSNQSNQQPSNNSNQSQTSTTETSPLEEFPEYNEVYSDETKIVYDYNNEYRIIVHKDGNEITGIEHYYNFGTEAEANKALESLKLEYANVEYTENIMQKGQYIKVVFNEEMYNNLTLTDIRSKYSDLSEIINL